MRLQGWQHERLGRFAGRIAIALGVCTLLMLMAAVFCRNLGREGPYGVFVWPFPLVGLTVIFQQFRGRPVTVGWLLGGMLCGALAGSLLAPTITHGPLRDLWATSYVFYGSLAGLLLSTSVCLVARPFRFGIPQLLELAVAAALVAAYWQLYFVALVRNDTFGRLH
jgi:hypothetical protein